VDGLARITFIISLFNISGVEPAQSAGASVMWSVFSVRLVSRNLKFGLKEQCRIPARVVGGGCTCLPTSVNN
jgi:hypothetical protein